MRIVVVLPAPSAPISPNISPATIDSDSSRTAATLPYDLLTRSSTAASAAKHDLRFDRHAALQHAFAVVDRDFDAVDQLRSIVSGLHVARGEFGFVGNLAD